VRPLNESARPGTRQLIRRALVLSVVFPVASWFFASWIGLVVGIVAVSSWWVLNRPVRAYWAAAAACVVATPIATWAQGLPQRSVAGADFVTRHWLANDLVLAALVLAGLAAVAELLGLDFERAGSSRSFRLAERIRERTRRRFQPDGPDDPEAAPGETGEYDGTDDEPGSQLDGLLPTT